MTNREYLESLNDRELAKALWNDQPWNPFCDEQGYEWGNYVDLLVYWLNQEYEG